MPQTWAGSSAGTDYHVLTRGERVCAFIEVFCVVPEGEKAGSPMRLDPFQRQFILAVYDNPETTYLAILSMAKKNGKTGLISAIVLAHLAGPEAKLNSQIVCGAMSREQASLVFDYAKKMVRLSPHLNPRVKIIDSRKRMYGLAKQTEFRALAADAKRTQGISPVVAILDEVGQVRGPRSEFVDAITTSQGAYEDALLFLISTQSPNDSDYLSTEIDQAKTGDDPHTICHVYEAPADCPVDDEKAWRLANPALGSFRSATDLRKLAEKAERMPSFTPTFRNLNLNQRVEMTSPFVSRDVWLKGSRDLVPYDGEAPIWCGLDLSEKADLTAFIGVYQLGGQWNAISTFWTPEGGLRERKLDEKWFPEWVRAGHLIATPGATVDYDYVASHLLEMTEAWNVQVIAFDRWRIEGFKSALARQEAPATFIEKLKSFGQGWQSMAPALDMLEAELLNGRLAHGGQPVLKMCAANAKVSMDAAGNRKLDKMKSMGRIDGMVALAMAMGAAAEAMQPTPEPEFQMFFLGKQEPASQSVRKPMKP